MSELEKPKRPWFRFHLLTLVLMTLAAGGLLFVNVHTSESSAYALTKEEAAEIKHPELAGCLSCRVSLFGWPFRKSILVVGDSTDHQEDLASRCRSVRGSHQGFRELYNALNLKF